LSAVNRRNIGNRKLEDDNGTAVGLVFVTCVFTKCFGSNASCRRNDATKLLREYYNRREKQL